MTVPYILRYTFEGPDLMIANAEPDDEGVYTCQVITKLDMAEASGTLTLIGKTTIIDYVTISQLTNENAVCVELFGDFLNDCYFCKYF